MMLEAILFNVITLLNVQLVKTQNSKITTQKSQEELLNSLELEKIKRGKKLKGENEQIGAYYTTQNLPSEFVYVAVKGENLEAYSLSKEFLLGPMMNLFPAKIKKI